MGFSLNFLLKWWQKMHRRSNKHTNEQVKFAIFFAKAHENRFCEITYHTEKNRETERLDNTVSLTVIFWVFFFVQCCKLDCFCCKCIVFYSDIFERYIKVIYLWVRTAGKQTAAKGRFIIVLLFDKDNRFYEKVNLVCLCQKQCDCI